MLSLCYELLKFKISIFLAYNNMCIIVILLYLMNYKRRSHLKYVNKRMINNNYIGLTSHISYDVMSVRGITPCIKIDTPLVVFTLNNLME